MSRLCLGSQGQVHLGPGPAPPAAPTPVAEHQQRWKVWWGLLLIVTWLCASPGKAKALCCHDNSLPNISKFSPWAGRGHQEIPLGSSG